MTKELEFANRITRAIEQIKNMKETMDEVRNSMISHMENIEDILIGESH